MIKPETRSNLEAFRNLQWFQNCGSPREVRAGVIRVQNWADAIDVARSLESENRRLEEANAIRRDLSRSPTEYQRWNSIVETIKPLVVDITANCADAIAEIPFPERKIVVSAARWDVLHFGIEIEYSDFIRTNLFREKAQHYINGRFPCGWIGQEDEGVLAVF